MKKSICKKCGYSWISRIEQPKECPNCKNRNWEVEKKKGVMKNVR